MKHCFKALQKGKLTGGEAEHFGRKSVCGSVNPAAYRLWEINIMKGSERIFSDAGNACRFFCAKGIFAAQHSKSRKKSCFSFVNEIIIHRK